MAGTAGTTDSKLNVDLNIVPFIDLMSCLTAFLLVTAAWVNMASIDTRAKGRARDVPPCSEPDACQDPQLSVLVEPDEIWIGVSRINELERIPNTPGGPDWDRLGERLRERKASSLFEGRAEIEVAVASSSAHPMQYQTLVSAMDVAVRSGFVDVGVTDPDGLSARPQL